MHESRSCQTIAEPAFEFQKPSGYEPDTLTTAPLRSQVFGRDGDSFNTSRSRKKKNGGAAWDHLHLSVWRVGVTAVGFEPTAVGFEPTPLRSGALSHCLRPLGHPVHVMLPRYEHDGFFHWLVRGEAR